MCYNSDNKVVHVWWQQLGHKGHIHWYLRPRHLCIANLVVTIIIVDWKSPWKFTAYSLTFTMWQIVLYCMLNKYAIMYFAAFWKTWHVIILVTLFFFHSKHLVSNQSADGSHIHVIYCFIHCCWSKMAEQNSKDMHSFEKANMFCNVHWSSSQGVQFTESRH